jgi:hypothetical protein
MTQLASRTWDRRRSGLIAPACEIGLGVLLIVVDLLTGGNTESGWVLVSVLSLILIASGLVPFLVVAGHISCDESGRLYFKTLIRTVTAEPGDIVSAMYKKRPAWLRANPVRVTTARERIWVTQCIDHKAELRSALLDSNPEMKLPNGAFK